MLDPYILIGSREPDVPASDPLCIVLAAADWPRDGKRGFVEATWADGLSRLAQSATSTYQFYSAAWTILDLIAPQHPRLQAAAFRNHACRQHNNRIIGPKSVRLLRQTTYFRSSTWLFFPWSCVTDE